MPRLTLFLLTFLFVAAGCTSSGEVAVVTDRPTPPPPAMEAEEPDALPAPAADPFADIQATPPRVALRFTPGFAILALLRSWSKCVARQELVAGYGGRLATAMLGEVLRATLEALGLVHQTEDGRYVA